MTDILVNSLVMAGVAACILVPVLIIRNINEKKKQRLIQNKLDEIALSQQVKFIRTVTLGNLLIAILEPKKLLLLNLVGFTHEILSLENLTRVKEHTDFNGKEVKNVRVHLAFNNGTTKDIELYKQYDNSERELSAARRFATDLASILTPAN